MILCPGQGLLGQTSHQVAEQIRLLMKCKFFIEKDSGEKEMAMQVNRILDRIRILELEF